MVLGDKAVLIRAFVGILNHPREMTLISIFTASLSSVQCAHLVQAPLAASASGNRHADSMLL